MVKSRAGLHGPHDAAGWSGFPDQFQIGAAESIRSAYTPLKPRTDGQPCHLSETTIYMQLTLLSHHSPQHSHTQKHKHTHLHVVYSCFVRFFSAVCLLK